MKAARTWIVVHDGMPDHPKIEALSDRGFRALITLWCWCSRQLTDGHVPKKAWEKRTTPAVRRELLAAGLVEELPDGDVAMHDYLDWQRSAVAVLAASEKKQSAARLGNHNRWHVKEGRFDPSCEHCVRPKPDPPPIAGAIAGAISPASQIDPREEERRGEERGSSREGTSSTERAGSRNGPPTQPPAREKTRCALHAALPADAIVPPCGACADVRRAAERQAADGVLAELATRQAWRSEVDACSDCDENGKLELPDGSLVRHHPDPDDERAAS